MESTRQIINAALNDEPLTIRNAIETVIGEKIAAALEEKKAVIAYNLIGVKEQVNKEVNESEEIDFEDFKAFLSDQLQMELDNDDVEYLLEDMDNETLEEILEDYKIALNEGKKN